MAPPRMGVFNGRRRVVPCPSGAPQRAHDEHPMGAESDRVDRAPSRTPSPCLGRSFSPRALPRRRQGQLRDAALITVCPAQAASGRGRHRVSAGRRARRRLTRRAQSPRETPQCGHLATPLTRRGYARDSDPSRQSARHGRHRDRHRLSAPESYPSSAAPREPPQMAREKDGSEGARAEPLCPHRRRNVDRATPHRPEPTRRAGDVDLASRPSTLLERARASPWWRGGGLRGGVCRRGLRRHKSG